MLRARTAMLRSPPRTRGSTRRIDQDAMAARVSPAHAGIDLPTRGSSTTPRGLPRARGDRPFRRDHRYQSAGSPPRTRGSTSPSNARNRYACVSPAHAGIDPFRCRPLPGRQRLPRARGDRPEIIAAVWKELESPPRTRGSTPPCWCQPRTVQVSPAHAGIDPFPAAAPMRPSSLPRARGDRPYRPTQNRPARSSPPRTRGSTRKPSALIAPRCVSPAHAGIDPGSIPDLLLGDRLPRARGDRPVDEAAKFLVTESPPRTRGSTWFCRPWEHRQCVSPAHAGIDLSRCTFSRRRTCLPRARGDRP